MNKDLEQAKALLENNEEYTCAACRAGESFASEEHGVFFYFLFDMVF